MPLPKPGKDETQDKFISRCMHEIKGEFQDNDQCLAVCFSQWKKKDEKESSTVPERRFFSKCEMRVVDASGKRKITGHAAVFNAMSEEMWGFREKIEPGAFAESIERDDIRALFNHDPNFVLGRRSAGTLRLWEDDKGLGYEVEPPDTQWARDLLVSIERRDITQNSFGFLVEDRGSDERWEKKDGQPIRTILRAKLFDVSPVTYPAYPQTEVFVRSRQGFFVIPEDKFLFGPPAETRQGATKGEEKANASVIAPPPFDQATMARISKLKGAKKWT